MMVEWGSEDEELVAVAAPLWSFGAHLHHPQGQRWLQIPGSGIKVGAYTGKRNKQRKLLKLQVNEDFCFSREGEQWGLTAGCLHKAGWKGVTAWVERECLLLLLWIPTHNPLPASREPASDCNSRKHYHDHWDSHLRNLGQKKSFPSPWGSTFWEESSQNLKATCAESSTVLSKFLQWLTTDS